MSRYVTNWQNAGSQSQFPLLGTDNQWSNPPRQASDNPATWYLNPFQYNFSGQIPNDAIVKGLEVQVILKSTSGTAKDVGVKFSNDSNTAYGPNHATNSVLPTVFTSWYYGGDGDMWGLGELSGSQIVNPPWSTVFGIAVRYQDSAGGTDTVFIEQHGPSGTPWISIRWYYDMPTGPFPTHFNT